jgi:hypothetical protein
MESGLKNQPRSQVHFRASLSLAQPRSDALGQHNCRVSAIFSLALPRSASRLRSSFRVDHTMLHNARYDVVRKIKKYLLTLQWQNSACTVKHVAPSEHRELCNAQS